MSNTTQVQTNHFTYGEGRISYGISEKYKNSHGKSIINSIVGSVLPYPTEQELSPKNLNELRTVLSGKVGYYFAHPLGLGCTGIQEELFWSGSNISVEVPMNGVYVTLPGNTYKHKGGVISNILTLVDKNNVDKNNVDKNQPRVSGVFTMFQRDVSPFIRSTRSINEIIITTPHPVLVGAFNGLKEAREAEALLKRIKELFFYDQFLRENQNISSNLANGFNGISFAMSCFLFQ